MVSERTDVLIIGSGFGAAAPALRLSEAGFGVTVIEKGPDVDPVRDFRQTQDPGYILGYLKGLTGRGLGFGWAEALGGGSGFFESVALRAPTAAFRQRDARGRPLWPTDIDRTMLDPWYERAEAMLRVQQIEPGDVPRTGQVFALMMRRLGYSCDRARYAVRGCRGCGFCVSGCIYGAKQSLHLNYIPAARHAGAVFHTDLEATSLRPARPPAQPDSGSRLPPFRYRVLCRSAKGSGTREFEARIVVLAAGTVGTARLLLASRPYLARLSSQVGRNIAFNVSARAVGLLPDHLPDADMFSGRSHAGMISYEFLDTEGLTIATAKPLPLQLLGTTRVSTAAGTFWGESHVAFMRRYRHRAVVLFTLGMAPPAASLVLGPRGEPTLKLRRDPVLESRYARAQQILDSILVRNGCELVRIEEVDQTGQARPQRFSTTHQVGSCRMADRSARGVCDAAGEVFGYPGLYVSDGSAIPSALAVNVSLTILANAERIAAGIVARH